MGGIKQKACYRPNFKPSKGPSNGTKKQEIWYTHPENLELLALKEMKLVAFLQMELFAKNLRQEWKNSMSSKQKCS